MSRRDKRGRKSRTGTEAPYIGLNFRDRADLRERIDPRVDEMVRRGFCRRCRPFWPGAFPGTLRPCRPSDTSSSWRWPTARPRRDQAVEEVKLRSRQYAKRQLTWLRRNPDIHWILWDREPDFPAALKMRQIFSRPMA